MKPFLTLVLTASAPTVVQARGGCGAHENCALLCRVADRDDDGRVDRGEMHAFLTLFGAAAHAHGNGDDGDDGVDDGHHTDLLAERLGAVLRLADPDAGGAHASCGRLFLQASDTVSGWSMEQFHLALTGDPSERRVTFATVGRSSPVNAVCALSDGRNFTASPYTYDVPARWWQPRGWVGSLYGVMFTGLEPAQTYAYTCSSDSTTSSIIHTFRTMPSSSPDLLSRTTTIHVDESNGDRGKASLFPTQLATFGDMGTFVPLGFEVFQALARSHVALPLDFVLQQGDISYAGVDTAVPSLNVSKNDEFEFIWDIFGRQIESIAASVPWMTGVGNHEAWYNFSAFRARYPMPGPASSGEGNFWYSFDYAGVHVISASSEHDLSDGSPQLVWIARDLKAANNNRKAVPWVVFAIHRPLYSSDASEFSEHSPGSFRLRQLEGLLLENKVDLTVSGHQHAYERCHPARNGTVLAYPRKNYFNEDVYEAPGAPVHLMVGSAGAFQHERWIRPAPAWSGKRFNETGGHPFDGYGFVRVTLYNRTHLRAWFESVSGKDSSMSDVFWVVKGVEN